MSISDDSRRDPAAPARAGGSRPLAVHRFVRPAGVRHLQAATVAAAAALSALLGVWVWRDAGASVGVMVVALALVAAMWISWFGEPTTSVKVEYGALVVTAGEREQRVDVAGADLRIDSEPGHRGWRAVIRRPGRRRPLVIDPSMVDPYEFTQVLARWRPDLRPGPGRVPGHGHGGP